MNEQYLDKLFDINKLNKSLHENINTSKINIIGELSEKTLHHTLKCMIGDANEQEIKIGKFYADIYLENKYIVEIQTGNFNKLRPKLDYYLENNDVTIVYPIIYKNEIIWIDKNTGDVINGNKQTKRTNYSSFNKGFKELYKIKSYLKNDNLTIVLLLIETIEHRYLDGYDKTMKKGATKIDKFPVAVIDKLILKNNYGYNYFTDKINLEYFSVSDYKKANKTSLREAGVAVNILSYLDVIKFDHKDGRKYIYQKNK